MNSDDIFNKELNDVRRVMRMWEKSQKELTGTIVESWRQWEKHIAQMTRDIRISDDMNKRSKEQTKRIGLNSKAVEKDTAVKLKARLEIIRHQKVMQDSHSSDVDRHLRMRDSMKGTQKQFDFITKSLTKGRGLASTFGMLVDGGYRAAKSSRELEKSLKRLKDAEDGGDPDIIKNAQKDVTQAKETKKNATLNSQKLTKIADSLAKAGDFFEKHATGIMIGAGAAGILIGIIIKALSIAPMFQAMLKLMKFAVTMILMPIGTFFGAMIKPMMVGLIKGIAPEFKKWMETSMILGERVGDFLVHVMALDLVGIIKNLRDFGDGLVKGDPAAVITTAVAVPAVIIGNAVTKRIIRAVKGNNVFGVGNKEGNLDKGQTKITSSPEIKKWMETSTGKDRITRFKNTIKNINPKDLLKGLFRGLFRGIGSIVPQKLVDVLVGVGENSPFIPAYGEEGEIMKENAKQSTENIKAVKTALDLAKSASLEIPPDVKLLVEMLRIAKEKGFQLPAEMSDMVNTFNNTKMLGYDINSSMMTISDMFSVTMLELQKKLRKWVQSIEAAERRDLVTSYAMNQARDAEKEVNQGVNIPAGFDPNFGGYADLLKDKLEEKEVIRLRTKSIEEDNKRLKDDVRMTALNASLNPDSGKSFLKRAEDLRNSMGVEEAQHAVNKLYENMTRGINEIKISTEGASILRKYYEHQSMAGAGEKAREEEENKQKKHSLWEISGGILGTKMYADGGWIREPVIGIGRNTGQAYSIGERGAEYVSPNGSSGGATININIAKIEKDADFTKLKPMIQRWILEANSRRGMI